MKKYFKRLSLLLLTLLVAGLVSYAICPKPELKSFIPYSKAYFDDSAKLLRINLAQDQRYRLFESIENISPQLIEATILYEDQNFHDHFGVDISAIFRAFWTTYISGERRIGASTIVMQLARLRWQLPSHTASGKFTQILRAIQLSRHYSKQQLLEAYLNLVPYGRNIEGIGAASLIYFSKKPSELSLPESLMLAVIPQNPNKRNPTTSKGISKLESARNTLFERWLEHHPSDQHQKKYMAMPLSVRPPEALPSLAPHFVDYLDKQQSNWDGGNIHSTLDISKQLLLERIVKDYVGANKNKGINNASALLVNYQSMEIKAMVGSADFKNVSIQGQVNGTTAKRSPGSTLKPFVYALAIDEGIIHPMSLLKDSPRRFGGFTPENYDKRFLGPVSATQALVESRNVPAVDLQARLKKTSFYDFLTDAKISKLKEESFYGLALALGGGEVTAIELAALYSTLANDGVWNEINSIKQPVTNNIEHPLMQRKQIASNSKRLLSPEASFLTLNMLRGNQAPNQLKLSFKLDHQNDRPWKTGTSWAFRDAWAAGISGPYVLIVWVGNFDGQGNDSFIGRTAAGPLFFKIWDAVYPSQDWKLENLYIPEQMNLKRLSVCSNTGDLYEKHCPSSKMSWFVPGVSPIKVSNIYRSIAIDKQTGRRACWAGDSETEFKVFEFWPSDFLHIFKQAGLLLKSPPPFAEDCGMDQTSTTGLAPVITSPSSRLEYVSRINHKEGNLIPFKALVDTDVSQLHWFIDAQYLGSASNGESLLWASKPGDYNLRVVDDSGRSATQSFKVISVAK